jgi:hypothetical protein
LSRSGGVGARDDHVLERLDRADVAGDVLHVLVVHEQHAGAGGVQDVGDPRAAGGVVDRHLDGAGADDPEPRRQELRSG